ncbi:MAG: UbiA prenyltransferase family protein [Minisyncoccia bacterium]
MLLRPNSWIKNFFIFVPLFFAKDIFNFDKLTDVGISFVAFSMIASSVYILNDIVDREHDRQHIKKMHRPIASEKVSVKIGLIVLITLIISSFALSYIFVPKIIALLLIYFILNIAYSFYLKNIAIVDVIVISLFYLIRLLIGGFSSGEVISEWLILCTIFISLFLIIGKRTAEFNQETTRKVLSNYTLEFLHGFLFISAALSIISYSLYIVLILKTDLAIYSIFFVILGIMRYCYIVLTSHKSEYPEQVIVSDKVILISGVLWTISMYVIFYIY